MIRRERLLILAVVLLITAPAVSAVVWPDGNSDWTAITLGSNGYADGTNSKKAKDADKPDDIRGSTSLSAGYYYLDDTNYFMLFRIRVNTNPIKADGKWEKRVWQVLFDTDGTEGTYEWALQLDMATKGADQRVEFGTVQHDSKDDTWKKLTISDTTWNSNSGYRAVATGETTFDNAADYFIDMAIPYSVFSYNTGLDIGDTFNIVLGTSDDHTNVSKDTPDSGDPADGPFSDDITFDVAAIPEPSSVLLTGFGLVALFVVRRRQLRQKRLRLRTAAARSPPPPCGSG